MASHRVVYHRYGEGDGMLAGHLRTIKDDNVDQWLRENCRGGYYHNPPWRREKFIEFDNEQDAVMFALRWA